MKSLKYRESSSSSSCFVFLCRYDFFQRNFALILKNIKEIKRYLELEPLEP
nr:MAG TPA: hypothetical protein [Caudoviricetes sp.]